MTRHLTRLGLISPLFVAATGAMALAVWFAGDWRLLTSGHEYIPMAPVTAAIFLVLGLGILARRLRPQSPVLRRVESAAALLTIGVAAIEALAAGLGTPPPWRGLLLAPAETAAGAFPMGRMSPLTATSFLLAGVALFASRRREPWGRWLATLGALAPLLIAAIVIAGYAAGAPLDYGEGRVPMALLTAVTLIWLGVSLLVEESTVHWVRTRLGLDRESTALHAERGFAIRLGLLSLGLAILIVAAAIVYTRAELAQGRAAVWRELDSVASLKARELQQWREERLGEGRFLWATPQINEDIRGFLNAPASLAFRKRVVDWLDPIRGGDRYESAQVFDAQGRLRLSIPEQVSPAPDVIEPSRPGDVPALSPVGLDRSGRPHLDLRVPIGGAEPVGTVILRVDPRRHLFPMLERWPVPSRTAEAILVRREGNEVVFLNDVRHRPGTALKLRLPVDSTFLPAARAARGELGTKEGVDYRAAPVISSARAIPGSTWILIAKVDQSEVYAPIRTEAARSVLVVVSVLLAVGLAAAYLLRERHALTLQRGLSAERERSVLAERLALVTQHANDIILVLSDDGRILEANERAAAAYGYTIPELLSMTTTDLRADGDSDAAAERLRGMAQDVGVRFESRHRRKDGSTFEVEISGRAVMSEGRRVIMAIHRDVSERKAHEIQVERLNRLYAALSHVNQAIVHAATPEGLLNDVCRALVEAGRFRMAWVGEADPSTNEVRFLAGHGDTSGYLTRIRITATDEPEGQGPTGSAIRENRSQVCSDVLTDPRLAPWREAALRAGYRSSIGLPLALTGGRRGALTVYAEEPEFFRHEEIALLEEAAVDTAFGLANLARDEQRRQAEASLRASEARYHSTLDNIIEGCQIIGFDWRVLYLNHAVERQNRRPNAEVLGRTLMEVWPGIEDTPIFRLLNRCREERIPLRDEIEFAFPDGVTGWFDVHCQPVPEGLFLMSVDVTREKQAAAAAARALAETRRFSEALDRIPAFIYMKDQNRRYVYANRPTLALFKCSTEELRGKSDADFFPPETVARLQEVDLRVLDGGEDTAEEIRIPRPDGSDQIFWEIKTPIYEDETRQRVAGLCGISTDITEIREAREALSLSEESLRKVSMAVEQSPVSIVITDPLGNIEYVNPHFARLTGYSRDEIVGQNPRLLQSGEIPPAVYREMWSRLSAGEIWEGEFHNRKKSGELFWERATIAPVRDAHGAIKSYVGVKEDITEERRAAEQMAAQLAELLRWQSAMLGREGRVQELKREVNALSRRLGHPVPYPSQEPVSQVTPTSNAG